MTGVSTLRNFGELMASALPILSDPQFDGSLSSDPCESDEAWQPDLMDWDYEKDSSSRPLPDDAFYEDR